MTLNQLLFCIAGSFFLIIAIVGVVIPGIPHTPFLLASAACFAKGSKKVHDWMLSNKYIGPLINDWHKHKRISKQTKQLSIIWIVLSTSITLFVVDTVIFKIFALVAAITVSAFILTRKSK